MPGIWMSISTSAGRSARIAASAAVPGQRLEREGGDRVGNGGRVDLPLDLQARPEAQRFELEVVAHEVELLLQRDALGAARRGAEHVSHHSREAQQRLLRGGGVA